MGKDLKVKVKVKAKGAQAAKLLKTLKPDVWTTTKGGGK